MVDRREAGRYVWPFDQFSAASIIVSATKPYGHPCMLNLHRKLVGEELL
jgi:hypothetical protein